MLQRSYRLQEVKPIVPKPHKRANGYWKRYHRANGSDRQEYAICLSVCRELGSPWQWNRRGRPAKTESFTYAAVHVYRRHTAKSYRAVERISAQMFGFFMDHSWVGRTLQRLPVLYLKQAVALLYGRIKANIAKAQQSAHIVDSTGITTDRCRPVNGEFKHIYVKLHIIVEYWRRLGTLAIVWCCYTPHNVHDSPTLRSMADESGIRGNGGFFGDAAYGNTLNRRLLMLRGFRPQLKPSAEPTRKEVVQTGFDSEAYKAVRGLIEGVFGGMEHRHGNRTRMRLSTTRENDAILLAASHNIQAYKQSLVIKICLFRRQPLLAGARANLAVGD